ncbi:MAG: hypothetical protein WD751_05885 [Anaerolineales bacterium]
MPDTNEKINQLIKTVERLTNLIEYLLSRPNLKGLLGHGDMSRLGVDIRVIKDELKALKEG